jgi:hypothetical protein
MNTAALRGMETVAEHINETQKVHEEFGEIFEELMNYEEHFDVVSVI